MMPARTTGRIHCCAQWPRTSVTTAWRCGVATSSVSEADADERRHIAARRRVDVGNRAVLRRQLRQGCGISQPRNRGRPEHFARIDALRPFIMRRVRLRLSPCSSSMRADLRPGPRVGRIERDRLAEMLERQRRLVRLPLDESPGRDRETPIRATRRSPARRPPALRPSGPRRWPPSRAPGCPAPRGTAAPRCGLEIGQRRIGLERGFEARERIAVTAQLEQRLAAADERGHIGARGFEARDRSASTASFASRRASSR